MMAAQLTLDLPATADPLRLPDDHPLWARVLAPIEVEPDFDLLAGEWDAAKIARTVTLFNQFAAEGGNTIRWDADLREFVTESGDRFCRGDVEDVVRGLMKGQA